MASAVSSLVHRFLDEVWNQRRIDVIDDILVPDYTLRSLQHGAHNRSIASAAGVKEHVRVFLTAFPDLHVTLDNLLVEGDQAAAHCSLRGTHRGAFFGIGATGKPVAFAVVTFFRAAGDRLREHATLFDLVGLLQQLGRLEETAKLLS